MFCGILMLEKELQSVVPATLAADFVDSYIHDQHA